MRHYETKGAEKMRILAIDAGSTESGYAIIEMPDFKLLEFGKVDNEELVDCLNLYRCDGWWDLGENNGGFDKVALEMVACYGMPVGKDVFETCVWIGRFAEALRGEDISFVYRIDEKMALCGSVKAKDSNIRQALIDRYAKFDFKNGKGVKKNPDTFYGVSKDAWQAIAVGVTYWEMQRG